MVETFGGLSVLIVGGAGFVGSNLTRRCLDDGSRRVVVVDNLLSAEADNLPEDSRIELRVGSISDEEVLNDLSDEFDVVFHLATYHGNQSSIANPLVDHDNNLVTTLKLYEHLKDFKRLKRLVYSSTGCALAEKTAGPVSAVEEHDNASLDMDSPYQLSKIVGEMYSIYFHRMHGLPVVRARFQNVYGPGEVLGAGEWRGTPATVWRNVVPTFVYRALKGLPLLIHGAGDSSRDFIYVDDIVEGLVRCASAESVEGDVFNLASGVEVSVLELAHQVNRLAANPAGIEFIPVRDWDRSINRYGSTRKSDRLLGFRAKTELGSGLSETVDWTRTNMERIDRCIEKHADKLAAV